MGETKIVVPKEMMKAAQLAAFDCEIPVMPFMSRCVEAALRWLAENPIVPTDEQVEEMRIKLVPVHPHWSNIVAEWQRRMFLAPEPEVPEAVKDLLLDESHPQADFSRPTRQFHNTQVIEAYRRGQKSQTGR